MQIRIGENGEEVVLPLKEYELLIECKNIIRAERGLTCMFDSDNRIAQSLLMEIRKFNSLYESRRND